MLVIDEAFDVWKEGKNPQDYHQWFEDQWRADLASMVLRDRNHPSVILWSIGNEIPERLSLDGNKTAWMLAAEVRTLDASHPITAAINGFSGRPVVGHDGKPDQPVFMYLDVAGYNYRWPEYERDHLHYPDRVMVGTESYPGESYDVWTTIDKLPYAIGDFVWTGLDHLGEAGLGSTSLAKAGAQAVGGGRSGWPWIINNSGDIDLIGQQKPQSLARDVVWGLSPVEITVQRPVPDGMVENVGWASWSDELASWTWPGAEGKALAVRIFTMGDRVELQLNGKTVGTRSLTSADKGKVEIPVPYVPGELIAVASRGGQELGRRRLITAGAPAALRLRPYRASLSAARSALTFITVEVVDAAGQLVPDAMLPLRITLDGPADLAAFGSANPRRPESFQDSTAYSYHGRAQAILRGRKAAGQVAIRLSSQHLTPATTVIPIAFIA
jgi:beta-galactosidase